MSPEPQQLAELLDTAAGVLEAASAQFIAGHRADSAVAKKGNDFATEIDLAIERRVVAELTRPLFESAIEPLLERIRASLTQLLSDAGVAADQVDTLFFTGGSSGVPALRQSVAAMLPNARSVEGNTFGSIGSGLAIEAKKRYG